MLTDRHYLLLGYIAQHDQGDATAIAAALGMHPDEVVRLLDDLADEGLVAPRGTRPASSRLASPPSHVMAG